MNIYQRRRHDETFWLEVSEDEVCRAFSGAFSDVDLAVSTLDAGLEVSTMWATYRVAGASDKAGDADVRRKDTEKWQA